MSKTLIIQKAENGAFLTAARSVQIRRRLLLIDVKRFNVAARCLSVVKITGHRGKGRSNDALHDAASFGAF